MQLEVFPDRVFMRREDPSQNICRFYSMSLQPDLFGGASLVREWERIGVAGQVRIDPHVDEGRAVDALSDLMLANKKRGYQ